MQNCDLTGLGVWDWFVGPEKTKWSLMQDTERNAFRGVKVANAKDRQP